MTDYNCVTYGSYDKNKKPLVVHERNVCFFKFNTMQVPEAVYIHYKTHNKIKEDYETEYFKNIKTLWHFKQTIGNLSVEEFNKEGIFIPVEKFTVFEVYTTLVALRYLDEFNTLLQDWHTTFYFPFSNQLSFLQTFILTHKLGNTHFWNSNHTFWTQDHSGLAPNLASPTLKQDIQKHFPDYGNVPCSKFWKYRELPNGNNIHYNSIFDAFQYDKEEMKGFQLTSSLKRNLALIFLGKNFD